MNKSKLALALLCASLPNFIYCMTPITPNEQLIEAADNWNLQQAQEAINNGADVNYQENIIQNTALHIAAWHGDAEMVNFLLQKGASATSVNINGSTPLHRASNISLIPSLSDMRASVAVAKLLLDARANINAQDYSGFTALHTSALFNNLKMTKLLIRNRARNLKTNIGQTALDIAKQHSRQEIVKLLSNVPSLKCLSAWTLVDLIKQNKLTLEQVKNSVPEELYELINKQL